jgi:hypothetical protein
MDADTTVRTLLTLAGLTPPEEEIQDFILGYPAMREKLDAMYAVPGSADADGILVFRAAE